jgi:Fic family protein
VSNPAAALAADDEIAERLDAARTAIDALLWRRDVRANAAQIAVDSLRIGARDSAAIEGADQFGVDDSPMGRVLEAAIAVTAEAVRMDDTWIRSPAQVLAHLHSVAASGFATPDELGRPRRGDDVDDPLHIGNIPGPSVISPRLMTLSDVILEPGLPAILEAAIVHGELLALRPFRWGSGLVARASIRTVFRARGLDPSSFTTPERGMYEIGRSDYVSAIRAFQAGTLLEMRRYIGWFTSAVQLGAQI